MTNREPIQNDPIRDAIEQTSNERTYHAAIAEYVRLVAERDRLLAENERMREDVGLDNDALVALVAERDRLQSEVEELKRELADRK